MNDALLRIAWEALALALLVAAPPVGAAAAASLVVAVLQTSTQLQEQTLGTAPRLIAAAAALVAAAPWIGEQLVRFTSAIFLLLPAVGQGS